MIDRVARKLSPDRLLAVSRMGDQLLQGVFSHEGQDTWNRIAQTFRDTLRARACAVFVAREEPPGTRPRCRQLDLRAMMPRGSEPAGQVTMTTEALFEGLTGEGGKRIPSRGARLPETALFGRWTSSLLIPLHDRKKRLLGAVLLADPLDGGGQFTDEDEAAAAFLAEKAILFVDNLRTFTILRDLRGNIREAGSFLAALEVVLRTVVRLLWADRGDITYYDWVRRELVVGPQVAPGDLTPGQILRDGLMRKVWEEGSDLLVGDVHDARWASDYRCCDERTQSELVIRLDCDKRRLAVLNLESFDLDGFDEQGRNLLRLLVEHAGIESLLVKKENDFGEVLQNLVENRQPRDIARSILESVRGMYGFDKGLFYVPDYQRKKLRVYVGIGIDRDFDADPFEYDFTDQAMATQVYNTSDPVFSLTPGKDAVFDPHGKLGLRAFQIKGPVLGLPLLVRDERVGVLVVWSNVNPPPTQEHTKLLLPFARLAAIAIRSALAEQRRTIFQQQVETILEQMQTCLSLEKNLQTIMQAIQQIGFDRVRVFRFRYGDSMEPAYCAGMGPHRAGFLQCVQRVGPPPHGHPYATHLVGKILVAHAEEADLFARQYPLDHLGPDPDGAKLGKSRDVPWVDVPLTSAGKLYGEIAADNARTRRQITKEDLEYMTFFGALAARAFAIEEKRGMLPAAPMALLYRRVGVEDRKDLVLRCLLRFLTHGEEGLGFSRALFLESDEAAGVIRFAEGVGSVTQNEFERIALETRRLPLKDVLDQATDRDEGLYNAMDGYKLELQAWRRSRPFPAADVMEFHSRNPRVPGWVQELGKRLDVGQDSRASERVDDRMLVATVQVDDRVLGLLVVDRHWQWRDVTDADSAVLATFAQQAGQILLLHDLQHDLRDSQDNANLGMLTKGLTHELRHPVGVLQKDTYTLRKLLGPVGDEGAAACLERITRSTARLAERVKRLQDLVRPKEQLTAHRVEDVFRTLIDDVEPRLRDEGIRLQLDVAPNLPLLSAIEGLLLVALDNLVRNAENALLGGAQAEKTITLVARRASQSLALEVVDNGPGIAAEHLRLVRQSGSAFTTSSGKGLGLGLAIVRRVAYLHQGRFDIDSTPGRGTRATLLLPIQLKGDGK